MLNFVENIFLEWSLLFISEKRQTMLYSATSTKKTEDLIKVALKKEPIYIGLEDQNQDGQATVMGLEQVKYWNS